MSSNNITYNYDQEADVLYISFSPGELATGIELNDHILLRLNKAEKRAIGITLMDFSILAQLTRFGPRIFPLTGLQALEPEWQDVVVDIITAWPVNQILRVSTYSPTFGEVIPVASVETPPILPLAV
jgi:uncharacterized protein YuzE